jgi:predicted dienelactone hydrolase
MEVIVVLALALMPGVSLAHEGERSEECPASSPRFRVGHKIRTVNVPGAFDPTTLTSTEDRTIQVHLWYPARDHDDCEETTDREGGFGECHAPPAVYTSAIHGVPFLSPVPWSPLAWTIPARIAFEGARVADGEERFPVVVFSHGNTNSAIDYAYTPEALASHGYVVAAPEHLNDTADDARIDFANGLAGKTVLACLNDGPSPCLHTSVSKSMIERFHDVQTILDTLPSWFGHRVDMKRVGIMGHSRGSLTTLAVAGGSKVWGFDKEPRIKALMGLAIGAASILQNIDLKNVTVPALLVAGTLDVNPGPTVSALAFKAISSTDKQLVLINDAVHRHFDSGLCAQMQSAGSIAQASSAAVLDRQTVDHIALGPRNSAGASTSGDAIDFCGYDSFTKPTDVTPLLDSIYATAPPPLTGFRVTPSNVPTHGLTSDAVAKDVVSLAVSFFGRVLGRADDDDRASKD